MLAKKYMLVYNNHSSLTLLRIYLCFKHVIHVAQYLILMKPSYRKKSNGLDVVFVMKSGVFPQLFLKNLINIKL